MSIILKCPECGALHQESEFESEKDLQNKILRQYRCSECGNMFNIKENIASKPDPSPIPPCKPPRSQEKTDRDKMAMDILLALISKVDFISYLDERNKMCGIAYAFADIMLEISEAPRDTTHFDILKGIAQLYAKYDIGSSAAAIVDRYINGSNAIKEETPGDRSDFGRCYRLIKETGINPDIMRDVSDEWRYISDNWENLCVVYDSDDDRFYDHLHEVMDGKYDKKGENDA